METMTMAATMVRLAASPRSVIRAIPRRLPMMDELGKIDLLLRTLVVGGQRADWKTVVAARERWKRGEGRELYVVWG